MAKIATVNDNNDNSDALIDLYEAIKSLSPIVQCTFGDLPKRWEDTFGTNLDDLEVIQDHCTETSSISLLPLRRVIASTGKVRSQDNDELAKLRTMIYQLPLKAPYEFVTKLVPEDIDKIKKNDTSLPALSVFKEAFVFDSEREKEGLVLNHYDRKVMYLGQDSKNMAGMTYPRVVTFVNGLKSFWSIINGVTGFQGQKEEQTHQIMLRASVERQGTTGLLRPLVRISDGDQEMLFDADETIKLAYNLIALVNETNRTMFNICLDKPELNSHFTVVSLLRPKSMAHLEL